MARGLEAHPIPLAGALVSARAETQPGRNPTPGALRGIDAGLQLPKQLPCGTSFFPALGAAWGWRQHRAVRRGPFSDRSLPSEGTGQVGRPCLDLVSSPVCSSPQPGATRLTAAHSSQAGGRVARLARRRNRAQRGGPSAKEGIQAQDPAKKAREAKAPPHSFCCCCCSWFRMERG